ncbi:MAG: hypothetical protein F6J86_22980 [Symploca sp. SIO1B1]|nr:hypothetical protein [Symploca sp. SIO1B1]
MIGQSREPGSVPLTLSQPWTESEYPRSPNYLEEENQVAIVKAINSFSFGLLNQAIN